MTDTAYEAKAQEAEANSNLPATQASRDVGAVDSIFDDMMKTAHVDQFAPGELMQTTLKIVQTSGGFMKANNPNYIPGAKEGDLVDTLTLRLRAVQTVIIVKFEMHYTTWRPKGGALVKQWFLDPSAYNAASLYEDRDYGFRVDGDGNWVAPTPTFYILMVDTTTGVAEPAIMYWGSTQASKTKRVNTLVKQSILHPRTGLPFQPPCYTRLLDLSTRGEHGKGEQAGKSWAGWVVNVGEVYTMPDSKYVKFAPAWYAQAKAFRDQIDKGNVRPAPPDDVEIDDGSERRVARPMGLSEAAGEVSKEIDAEAIPF